MGYQNLVDSNLKMAYRLLKDLAISTTLQRITNVEFDFNAVDVVSDSMTDTVAKAVKVSSDQKSNSATVIRQELMYRRKDVPDINSYTKILFEGNEWTIGNIIKDDGYITLVEVYRTL